MTVQPSFTEKQHYSLENIILESIVVFSVNEGCIVNKDHSECFVDGLECAQRVCRPRFSEKRGADHYLSPKSQINSQHAVKVRE